MLVAGTASVTEAFNQGGRPAAVPAPHGNDLRTGTFETAGHRVVGQIVAYPSHPSWVYMNVDVANYNGRIVCMLQSDNGSTVATGTFELHGGVGEFSGPSRCTLAGSEGRGSLHQAVPLSPLRLSRNWQEARSGAV